MLVILLLPALIVLDALIVSPLAVNVSVTVTLSGNPIHIWSVADTATLISLAVPLSVKVSPSTIVCEVVPSVIVNVDELPAPVLLIVTVSVLALVVKVTLVPATSVSVSLVESATTSDCPATVIVANVLTLPAPLTVPASNLPVVLL